MTKLLFYEQSGLRFSLLYAVQLLYLEKCALNTRFRRMAAVRLLKCQFHHQNLVEFKRFYLVPFAIIIIKSQINNFIKIVLPASKHDCNECFQVYYKELVYRVMLSIIISTLFIRHFNKKTDYNQILCVLITKLQNQLQATIQRETFRASPALK